MAHCPYDQLADLEPVLEALRALPKIKEAKPGIFYLKGRGFLHFHVNKAGERWADVADAGGWGEPIPLPFKAPKTRLAAFLKEAQARHRRVLGG